MKKELLRVATNSTELLREKSPLILLIGGIGLGIGAVGLSGVASYKAAKIVKDIREDPACDDPRIAALTYAKRIIPLYIPVALVGTGSVVCLVKSYDINAKRLAAATALAEISIETFKMYREKAKKVLGEEAEEKIREEVKKEKIFKPTESEEETVPQPKSDIIWFVDSITKQEFLSTREAIKDAALELNLQLHSGMYVSIDEWMDILNENCCFKIGDGPLLKHQDYFGDQNGWREGYPVYVDFTDYHTADGKPALKIGYNVPPIMNYRERYF